MPSKRLLQPKPSPNIPQNALIRFLQFRQNPCELNQLILRNNNNPLLRLVQNSEIPRPHDNTPANFHRNIDTPRLGFKRRPYRRRCFAPNCEAPFCAQLAASSEITDSSVDDDACDSTDGEAGGDDVA